MTFTVKLLVDVVLKGEVVKAFYSRIFISGEVLGHLFGLHALIQNLISTTTTTTRFH